MREMNTRYSTGADAVSKRLDELDVKMAEIEKNTNAKLQHIADMLEQIKKKQ